MTRSNAYQVSDWNGSSGERWVTHQARLDAMLEVLADQPADVRDRACAAVRRAFAARPGERSVLIEGAAWIVTARNPG